MTPDKTATETLTAALVEVEESKLDPRCIADQCDHDDDDPRCLDGSLSCSDSDRILAALPADAALFTESSLAEVLEDIDQKADTDRIWRAMDKKTLAAAIIQAAKEACSE